MQQLKADGEAAVYIPLDGYHLTRSQLSAMADPEKAHARRGAAFTFDDKAFLRLVQRLRRPCDGDILVPSFDHARKDPVADDIRITFADRIVVLEGNYLSLAQGSWQEAAQLMHKLWFVEVDFATARQRLIRRHIAAGLAEDEMTAGQRADQNDLINGHEIVADRLAVHHIIRSLDEPQWA